MFKKTERICAIWKNIILKKYYLSTQIEFIDETLLCQQQQMWTNYSFAVWEIKLKAE